MVGSLISSLTKSSFLSSSKKDYYYNLKEFLCRALFICCVTSLLNLGSPLFAGDILFVFNLPWGCLEELIASNTDDLLVIPRTIARSFLTMFVTCLLAKSRTSDSSDFYLRVSFGVAGACI